MIKPRSWLPKRVYQSYRIEEAFTAGKAETAKPWKLFDVDRPKAKYRASGRKAGNTRMVMALVERLLPRKNEPKEALWQRTTR